jgi:hypothetical protein
VASHHCCNWGVGRACWPGDRGRRTCGRAFRKHSCIHTAVVCRWIGACSPALHWSVYRHLAAFMLFVLFLQSIYYISVSGVLYDIIRGVPPFGYDQRTRRAIFIANQSGTQYGIEGLIIGALNSAAAFCVILMARFFPKIRNAETRNYATIAAAGTFLFLFYQVYSLYNYKNSWYSLWMLIRG